MRIRLEEVGQNGPDDPFLQVALKAARSRLQDSRLSGTDRLWVLADIERLERKALPENTLLGPFPVISKSQGTAWRP